MRVTPKTRVRPQAVMNSDEALASPFSAWIATNERSIAPTRRREESDATRSTDQSFRTAFTSASEGM